MNSSTSSAPRARPARSKLLLPLAECHALLARAPSGHLAATLAPDQPPMMRPMHHAWFQGALWFHGAPRGEKSAWAGAPACFSATEIVASIPSYFRDPRRACPATTLFRAVQVRGTLEAIEDRFLRSDALAVLMAKLQPEGGHLPMAADHPAYTTAITGLGMWRLVPETIVGRRKLAQDKSAKQRRGIVDGLWRRGAPGDLAALEEVLTASPDEPRPDYLRGPGDVALVVASNPTLQRQAATLLEGQYWNTRYRGDEILAGMDEADAWIGARASDGALIATAAALSNRRKHAWIYDVAVAPEWQGRGVGRAVLACLMDHPMLRDAARITLKTKDAQEFYRPFGFVEIQPDRDWTGSTAMLRVHPDYPSQA